MMSQCSISFKPEYNLLADAYLGSTEKFNEKLRKLAEMAKPEDWDFQDDRYRDESKPLPILYNYLNFTYDRLKEEGKLAISPDGKAMCFNTGLQTDLDNDIYAFFIKNRNPDKQPWYFVKFCQPHDIELAVFSELPDIAEYIDNASDLIFDSKLLPIRVNYEHIIRDNKERFSAVVDYDEYQLRQSIESAIKRVEERVRRNYKIAIPQYYPVKSANISKIQLLLPLCLKSPHKADLALVVSKEGNAYIAKTVLPLDWAYMNSRRIVRPDADWILEQLPTMGGKDKGTR